MTAAYCFSCAAEKSSLIAGCPSCKKSPTTEAELVWSLVLSEEISTPGQLAHFANEVRSGHRPTAPDSLIAKARAAASNPKYRQVLAGARPSEGTSASNQNRSEQQPRTTSAPSSGPRSAPSRRLTTTALHESAFCVLGVTSRDSRKRIVELAEEKSLELESDVCQKARSDLTNPRIRLSLEIAWLPGVSPRKATQLIAGLIDSPMSVRAESGLPTLAHLNLLAAAFEAVDSKHDPADLAAFIVETAYLAEELSSEEVLRDINEDRAVSGFPEVRALDQIEAELVERKRYFRGAIKDALNRLPPMTLIQVMTETVDAVTSGGDVHAPGLVDDLVDSYEVETQDVLQKEAENVRKLIKAAREQADAGETAVKSYVDSLEAVARNWDRIAQPIQLSSKARGIDHEASRSLAYEIRGLAIDLFNKHDMLAHSQRLTALIQELFSEVPEIADRAEEDAGALSEIAQRRSESELINPIRKLCESISNNVDGNPSGAHHDGQRLLQESSEILKSIRLPATSPTYREARDLVAATLQNCAVSYGNKTSRWEPCVDLLERATELASDPLLRQRLQANLATVRSNIESLGGLEPISSAPSLSSINGVGFTLYGNTDGNPSNGSYMATYYFVILFIPIFPIARYRVIPTGGGYKFLGKGSLRTFDKWHIAISMALIGWMFLH